MQRLKDLYPKLSSSPSIEECVRGCLLEKPRKWKICGIEFTISRFYSASEGRADFAAVAEEELVTCLAERLRQKTSGKADTFRAYRSEGWKTLLVIELSDFQLASLYSLADSFRTVASNMNLSDYDAIALVQNTFGLGYCWAYKDGRVPSRQEQLETIWQSRELAR